MLIFLIIIMIALVGLALFCFSLGKRGLKLIQDSKEAKAIRDALIYSIESLKQEKEQIKKVLEQEQTQIKENLEREKDNNLKILFEEKLEISKELEDFKRKAQQEKEDFLAVLESEHKNKSAEMEQKLIDARKEFEKLKNSLAAGAQANLREKEKKDNLKFYKLNISDVELEDIKKLENLKLSFHSPVILSKLVWTQYFQKQTTDLCNRVFGQNMKCGIYKITSINTQQCYVGQSIKIQDRIKQHIKAGCGIEASSTNKLYKAMQEEGVWNFTFELLEECNKEELDEKEKQWIEMYQSNIYGLNTMKGNH